jgi:hypothetical protein
MKKIIFSILIPSIPSRVEKYLIPLLAKLQKQIGERKDVEILTFLDNKKRSVGQKRDNLVQLANGQYLAFVDDDDDVSDDYVEEICQTIYGNEKTDVIVFDQIASINGLEFKVSFGIEYENEQAQLNEFGKYDDIKRKPFHICVWRSEIAVKYKFPDCSYGEDWFWAKQVHADIKTQHRIDKVLHYYRYNDVITEAEHTYPPNQVCLD